MIDAKNEGSFKDEVIINAGKDGRLDSAVLACASIDLYSRKTRASRLRNSHSASQLPAIPEATRLVSTIALDGVGAQEEADRSGHASPGCNTPKDLPMGAGQFQQSQLLQTPARQTSAPQECSTAAQLAPDPSAPAQSAFHSSSLPALHGRGTQEHTGFKRSFSDPCSRGPGKARPKRHSRCLTEAIASKTRHVKPPESSLKSLLQASKPPLRDRRRHKRMQSIDITNDPSCKLVATL